MSKTLQGLLREFNVTVIPISRSFRRAARETCAGKTLAHVFRLYGYNHTRMVVMSIVESKPNKKALIGPVVWGVSDLLAARPSWFGDTWFQALDGIDLVEMFEHVDRRVAAPRAFIATALFEALRSKFPDEVRAGARRRRLPVEPELAEAA